jgi:type VII secretion integral membrane protein EccD
MPLCRLSIHAECFDAERFDSEYGDTSRTVDVALPTAISVHALLPAVLDLAGLARPRDGEPVLWRLNWTSGAPIDLALTLTENDVRDGDLLVLTPHTPSPPRHRDWDPCAVVTAESDTRPESPVAEMICGWALLAGAVTLAWTGLSSDRIVHLVIAAVAACTAMALAISTPHRSTLRVAAVGLCAATGFLAVPSGPAAANAFLAAAAACSSAALLARWTDLWSPSLIAVGGFSTIVALSTAIPLAVPAPPAAAGPIVTTVSLGMLAVSARLAATLSGLAPRGDPVDLATRAARGHAVLSGLVAGCACGAAAGATLVFIAHLHDGVDPLRRAAFTGVVAVVLVMRVRVHVDPLRRAALTSSGLACATTALAMAAAESAALAAGCAALVIGAGLATVVRRDVGPAAGRGVDAVDYVALTAVIPLACWVGGVYAVVRGWHST